MFKNDTFGGMIVKSILAGMCIAIAGNVFIMTCNTNKIIAAFLFALGLTSILQFKFYLFTGKIGYLPVINLPWYSKLKIYLIIWLGNGIGVFYTAMMISKFASSEYMNTINSMSTAKLATSHMDLFIKGFLCGVLMLFAVYFNEKESINNSHGRGLFITILCVAVFILSGFEHSIADMFYFTMYLFVNKFDTGILQEIWKVLVPTLVITLGNSIGAIFAYLGVKLSF